jgi:hypothetical protein
MAMILIFVLVMIVMTGVTRRRHIMLLDGVVARRVMSVSIVTVLHIDGGMVAPVGMNSFPVMKARHANRIERQPDVAGSQIEICTADDTDIFDAVPDISIRNTYFHRYCRSGNCYHGCGNLNLHRRSGNLHRDYRSSHQWQGRETCDTNRYGNFFCSFHTVQPKLEMCRP